MSPPSTRWCPTPEQLMILEELYRRGVRTPNAAQIQKIATHLAFYGKIQCKNVFYWFQNHKARDRQKMRKKLANQLHQQHLLQQHLLCRPTAYQPQQSNSHFYPYNLHYFHIAPPLTPPFHHQLFSTTSSYSAESLRPQATGSCEEAPIRHENWRLDLPKDWTIGGTSSEEGPTCSQNRPRLQTLELFPLKSDRQTGTSQTV